MLGEKLGEIFNFPNVLRDLYGKMLFIEKREIPGSEDYEVLLLRSVIFKIEVLNKSLQAL